MSNTMGFDWVSDINGLYHKFGLLGPDQASLHDLVEFRVRLQEEESAELRSAIGDWPEFVDALIDSIVVAIGSLVIMGVDAHMAWDEVLAANLKKNPGKKPGRDSPSNADLVKPPGWVRPNHSKNIGILKNLNMT